MAIKTNKKNIKFKLRCSRFLYTFVIRDAEKAKKLRHSLPPGKLLLSDTVFILSVLGYSLDMKVTIRSGNPKLSEFKSLWGSGSSLTWTFWWNLHELVCHRACNLQRIHGFIRDIFSELSKIFCFFQFLLLMLVLKMVGVILFYLWRNLDWPFCTSSGSIT